jgi:hypothetical protein
MAGASESGEGLAVVHPHAAGIDVGNAWHWVAVPPDSPGLGGGPAVRRFGTFTAEVMS